MPPGASSGDTIFALSSAPGRAGVAVYRLSGRATENVVAALCGRVPTSRIATVRQVRDPLNQETIDQGLILWMPGPASFTGEDCAELHLHGGRAIQKKLLDVLARQSHCRLAEPGEFALRAFHSGRIDLAQAEGLADLIDAETEAQRRQAVRQATGAVSAIFEEWRGHLLEASALVEAAIDFSDESDISDEAFQSAVEIATDLKVQLAVACEQAQGGEIVRDGLRVTLAGPVNVGKSSLLNALAKREAAIVSDQPGTTRDVIEVQLDLGGMVVTLADTAGLRDAHDAVEQIGIARSHERMRSADLVLWLHPVQDGEPALPPQITTRPHWLVRTKADLNPDVSTSKDVEPIATSFLISSTTGAGLENLLDALSDFAADRAGDAESLVITQARHRGLVETAIAHLEDFVGGDPEPIELRAEDLRLAVVALGKLTGRIDVEDVLGAIFGRFCIGK